MFNQAFRADRSGQDGFDEQQETLRAKLLPKLRRVLAHVPFAADLLSAYYAVLDRETPLAVRATLGGALAYFVLPIDVIPDFVVGLGFSDDAAVLLTAMRIVSGSVKDHHRDAARRWLEGVKPPRT